MPAITFKPRVKETSTTTGTGSITLAGAVVGYQSFDDAFVVTDDYFYYCIEGVDGNGVPTGQWEEGIGHLSGSTTLVRDTLLSSSTGSAVSFSAGTKNVFCTVAATYLNQGVTKVLGTAQLDMQVGTKQAVFTVPPGYSAIITQIVMRNPTASLGAMGDSVTFGFDGGGGNWGAVTSGYLSFLVATDTAIIWDKAVAGDVFIVGNAGDVFGGVVNDTSIASLVSVDVIGYLV